MIPKPTGFLNGSSDWTFGQVIAILLLAGPLLTIVESFRLDDGRGRYHPTGETTHELLAQDVTTVQAMPSASGSSGPCLAPSENSGLLGHMTWSSYSSTLDTACIYCMLISIPILLFLIYGAVGVGSFTQSFALFGAGYSCYFFLFAPVIGLWELILLSLAFKGTSNGQSPWIRPTLRLLGVSFFPSSYLSFFIYVTLTEFPSMSLAWLGITQATLVVFYGLFATLQAYLNRH
ncbi:hypothetical protein ASPBRDRAFT_132119 [Aspergillus brasiliensis CBS 101740]|uniref:Uncharacterized protein n=1 Tax=Aspergillus brasiliensis (strain CBS 101740 / IMI 381727 / IBT 21946) TaxID=767769 RepID=A0A1L9UBH5_ASPBC|nr:hypothetical protein ASPBRDRAFT_132119 [Aspergillus brasiliensis CBS 101740]